MNEEKDEPNAEVTGRALRDLTITVDGRPLLKDVNVVIPEGKITVIVGISGAGKSVLLRVLAGLIPKQGAVLRWSGQVDFRPSEVGVVFQQFALFDELSPVANVQFAIDHRSSRDGELGRTFSVRTPSGQGPSEQVPPRNTAREWLKELGVPAGTPVSALSGGQKQRLAIARTLAADPEVIVYDEPTSGLDAASGTKVANLIRETQRRHQRTSLVVTHDYATLISIADAVLWLDPENQTLVSVPPDEWGELAGRMRSSMHQDEPTTESPSRLADWGRRVGGWLDAFLIGSGRAFEAFLRLPWDARPWFPSLRWAGRFTLHYLRLVGGPSAWVYLVIAGLIAGFTTTFFTFRFLPFRLYTQPLLIDELLASIGFALYRILVPILATILIAARCGAAVAADVGVKRYGGQVDALRTLGVRPEAYLLVPMMIAFLIATPLLEWLAFVSARSISAVTFVMTHESIPAHYWHQHFFRHLRNVNADVATLPWGLAGSAWVLVKNVLCGVGTAVIGYHQAMRTKTSATDVSAAITSTVLWTTLWVLMVHFVVALIEF